MKERPLRIYEDDEQDDLENEVAELSLNRRTLFLSNGFFREWLSSSSREGDVEDEDDEDDDKSFFGSRRFFRSFIGKIFEGDTASSSEKDSDEEAEEDEISLPELDLAESDVSQNGRLGEYVSLGPNVEDETNIDEYKPGFREEDLPENDQLHQENTQQRLSDKEEYINIIHDKESATEEDYFDNYLQNNVTDQSAESSEIDEGDSLEDEEDDDEEDKSFSAILATSFKGLVKRKESKEQPDVETKNIEEIRASLSADKMYSGSVEKHIPITPIKDEKITTENPNIQEKTDKKTEVKEKTNINRESEKQNKIVIEKATENPGQNIDTRPEVYFDRRHEALDQEIDSRSEKTSKERLKETKLTDSAVSVGSVIADRWSEEPRKALASTTKNEKQTKGGEPFTRPEKSLYRESAEVGFMIGVTIIGFIVVYLIAR